MKIHSTSFIIIVAASAFMFVGSPLLASHADDCIVKAFKKSSIFRTFLENDEMKIESKDGSVTLTGTVSHEFHISLAQDTIENIPAVKCVDNRLTVSAPKAEPAER